MKFKVFAWCIGLILIVLFGLKAVFSYLYVLGLITPGPDFIPPNTLNLIDRTLVSTIIVISGIFLFLRKKECFHLLFVGTMGTIIINFLLINAGDAIQYIKGPDSYEIAFLSLILLILKYSLKKNYLE